MRVLMFIFLLIGSLFGKDTLIVGVENDTPRLNPFYDEDHNISLSLIFSGLFEYKDDKLQMNLLSSAKKENDLEYSFKLKENIYFHDGHKLTSDDVIFTLNMAKDESLNTEVVGNFLDVKEVVKIDDFNFKIILNQAYPSLYEVLSIGIVPKHILEKISLEEFDKNPIGSGPYKFVEKKIGEYVKLKAYDNYYKGKAKIENVILKFVTDPSVVAYELENKSLDLAIVEPSFLDKLSKNKKLAHIVMPSNDYRALMFNMNKFKDAKLRQALDLAICKEDIVKGILKGRGTIAYNPIQNQVDVNIKYETCDKNKALNMLKELGYEYKNKKLYKDGKPFTFDVYSFNFDLLRTQMAYYVKQELEQIGVSVNVYSKPHGSFKIDQVDSFVIGWGSVYGADFYTYRVFSKEYDTSTNDNGLNYNHYNDEIVSSNLQKARNEENVSKKNEYYKNALEQLKNNPPYVFLAYIDYAIVYNKDLKGIKSHTLGHHGNGYLYGIEDFYFGK